VNRSKFVAMLAAGLIAGIVLGSVASGYAATTTTPGSTNSVAAACAGAGLRLGSAMRDSGGRLLDVVAKLTGKTTAEVTAERAAGKTMAQIGAEKGVSQTAIVDAALKVRKDVLATKVKAGDITQAQADTALTTMKTRLSDRVTSTNANCDGTGSGGGKGVGGKGKGMGGGNGGGAKGAGCANCTATN
jgi:hypothetical protein